ncbi:FAD-dependent oxidoreductase [Mycobacterium branderi]|uniref:4-hydroxyacetophenone monooxygenase n=1 Tax=Mycobacterium branderi TaxID=43348 RepID=A0A7I7WBS0_9MYCO|nr:FAD-dependent oxidoreductase [Mycobacterium branderi]MCV7232393.1 NAD(P)-binding domain-containing protein [Mycobacterium branderi]ORA36038.1 4-hydroxyacetophenone monooxygenase [Mycobacterium branderi]BBZ14417.1 4-hydroxyacetophenone monooxygenase [Mycobacterium branderi]
MTPEFDVIIVGAGFAGLGAAIKLREAGINNITVLEKAADVGGTWRENTYPGAACDVMSLMYSYSFAPNPNWTRGYACQPEILAYLRAVTDRYGLRRLIRFGVEVTSSVFDDDSDIWTVTARSAKKYTARVIIDATGPLHIPKIPKIAGAESFSGTQFHSSQWDHGVDIIGKSVAVIGTGASAAQIIPSIAEHASTLSVFQRTPHWVLPRPDRPITAAERAAYRRIPGLRKAVRAGIYFSHEALTGAFLNPRYMPAVRALAKAHLRRQVRDPQLRAVLTPDYEIGCKRMIIANDYYPALQRRNVSLVTDAIVEITPSGIRTANGALHQADIIVYATGFAVTNKAEHLTLVGRDGRTIQQVWAEGPEAYLGMAVYGFPNYFMIMGPNTGVGNQSVVFMIEAQVRYIVACIRALADRESTRVEVKSHVQAQFNRELQRRSDGTVWTAGGCDSWYLDGEGVNRAIWPATTMSYWRRTRRPDLADFDYSRIGEDEADADYSGPAVLVGDEGDELAVQVRLMAQYEPLANAVCWSGRVMPSAELRALHRRTNQPIRLQINGSQPVDALLLDADPWGGSHICGKGECPYPYPLEAELALLERS